MKILNLYRSRPDDTVKKLVEIVTRDRESEDFDLNVDSPEKSLVNRRAPQFYRQSRTDRLHVTTTDEDQH